MNNKNLLIKDCFKNVKNELVLVTNNEITKDLTLKLLEKYKQSYSFDFKIVDIGKMSITKFYNGNVIKEINKDLVDKFIINNNIFSFPIILVLKFDKVIEEINCSYSNIMDIIKYYI
jgi:hypothetical protein